MLTTIFIFIIVLSLPIFVHELGHFVAAKLSDVRVEEVGLGMLIRIFAIKRKGRIYSLNALPIGAFVRLTGEDGGHADDSKSFSVKSKKQRFFILVAGVVMNFLLAIVVFTVVYLFGMPEWGGEVVVKEIVADAPAAQAGIQQGDIFLKVEGIVIETGQEIWELEKEKSGKEVSLEILRGDEILKLDVLLRSEYPEDQGPLGVVNNIRPKIVKKIKYSFFRAPVEAVKLTIEMTYEMVAGLVGVVKSLLGIGQVSVEVAGFIGIGQIVNGLLGFGLIPVLQFVGIFSLNLALINIIPFPALDGGRILFVLVEAVIGKKVSPKFENFVHAMGIFVILALMILVTYKDVLRILE